MEQTLKVEVGMKLEVWAKLGVGTYLEES